MQISGKRVFRSLLQQASCFFLVLAISCLQAQNTLFTLLPSSLTNVDFNNVLMESEQLNVLTYQYLYNGGGVAVGDIDNDGFPDIFYAGNMVSDKLYLNNGNFLFEDITLTSGIMKTTGWSTGVTMADVNADGFLDIYICRSGPYSGSDRKNVLYINNKDRTFTDQAKKYGLNDSSFSTQSVFFDMDLDGDLDMFLLNHAVTSVKGLSLAEIRKQRDVYAGNKLFENKNGYFIDISQSAGIYGSAINFGLGIVVGDINNDNYPDIFVTNDYQEVDFLYLNNKNGTFTEINNTSLLHTSNFSMGCDLADINNDGWLDLFVADMLPEDNYRKKILQGPTRYDMYQLSADYGYGEQIMQNTLQLNNGNNTFSEIAQSAGIAATDWSWAPLFADFDNDGYLDLFITNGYRRDFTDMDFMKYTYAEEEKKAFAIGKKLNTLEVVEKMPSIKVANYIYRGNSSLQFENKIVEWGFNTPSFSNGAAYADLDNDGDLDLVINNINDESFIYKNNAEQLNNNYIRIKLIGSAQNLHAIGARITVFSGKNKYIREQMPVRGYASSVDQIVHFGLGDADADSIIIIFPNRKYLFYQKPAINTLITADIKNAIEPSAKKVKSQNFFTDVTNGMLFHINTEENYVDFKREPLLIYKLSQSGPAFTTGDLNGDLLPDLFIGGAKNKKAKIYFADKEGTFQLQKNNVFALDSAYEDVDALFFDADGDHDLDLYVVSGSNEYPENSEFYQDRLYFNDGVGNFVKMQNNIPQNFLSNNCVAAADFDNDGDLDLFVGGKLIPGKFPLSPPSFLLQNNNGVFSDITSQMCPALLQAGMLNDAVWLDIDKNNYLDLIIVGDWMPIRIFLNFKGKFVEASEQYGLKNTAGWWNCINAGDFDADGDIDLIVGNRGTNNQIKATINQPAILYAYDFDNNGSIDPILNYYYNDSILHPFHSRDDLLDQINILKKKFVYYRDYGNATMESIFPKINLDTIPNLKTEIFESVYLENNANKNFIITKLPTEAQWFSINCSTTGYFNNDEHLDIIIAGNNYSIRPELGKMDAGFGLLLCGDGKGNFFVIPNKESGLNIPGDTKEMQSITMFGKDYIVVVKNQSAAQVILIND